MKARISRPAKNAMQSGRARTRRWLLEFEQEAPRDVEPLMGWTSSADTRQQVRLWFDTRDEAIAYAEHLGAAYTIEAPEDAQRRGLSYSDNFKFDRQVPWTH